MKTYIRSYKKAPTASRLSVYDSWDRDDRLPVGFAAQSGFSPRGCNVRFNDVHRKPVVHLI